MSDNSTVKPSPTSKPTPAELTPEELEQISGGIKGESQESNHKDWILG